MTARYAPIGEYGVVGDLYTVALVGMDGSIDFLCLPHFDSPSVFAALVDAERGGRFQLAPLLESAARKQLYLPDTNVLLTRFLDTAGVAEVSDFMPVEDAGQAHNLVRRAKTVRGEVRFQMRCDPRFDYGRATHTVERRSDTEVLFFGRSGNGDLVLRLRSSVPMRVEGGAALSEFTLGADESAWFVLEVVLTQEASPSEQRDYQSDAFKQTVNFWRQWVARSTYSGRWRETVNRSALALKLLTSRQYGSIVAAPTFGLPETIGGVRNWDYRYTWIRDSSFTLYGLMRLGYTDEAAAFMQWMMARCQELEPDGSLQIMYGLDGRHVLSEETLPHFEGYMGSRPVRIGNAAFENLQLDIYGELMDAIYLYDKYGSPIGHDAWTNTVRLIEWVCANWQRPDESIWEVRGGRQEFLYSRVMCWVAIDRAIRLALKRSFPAPLARWHEVRDTIYRDVFARFWDPTRRAFIQHVGATTLDAATLLMPLVRFISPTDPRWMSTLRAIEHELVSDSLVYRYRLAGGFSDGLTGDEGTFSMCSFWYVECLSRTGDLHKARFLFEKMLGYANHLGLYGEELGPQAEHLGNFPQAFTHLALISAAFDLDRRLSAAGHAGVIFMATTLPRRAPTTVGLVTHPRRDRDAVFTTIASWVRARGSRLIALPEEAPAAVSPADQLPAEDFARTAELVIAAGGDGTILRALALAAPAGVPVLGVNLGRLGFLAEVDPSELERALEAIGAGDYRVEERLALECTLPTDDGSTTIRAFNDLVVWRQPGFGQAALAVSVGGELFARYAADGIILATPTGSTAYTLSVGGPIVSPAVDAILVTPLAPHGLFNRTLTVAAAEVLAIDVLAESAPVVVERDGKREREVTPGARIAVRRSDAPGLLVRLGWTSFYGRARRKLQLADPIVLGDTRSR